VVANVGDSRAVLSRGGRALDLSTEHRVWGKTPTVLSEIERIEAVGGWVDDGRVCGVLAVSRWAPGGSAACCCRTALQQISC
jgi:protein phosphatase 2C family protein 2/3